MKHSNLLKYIKKKGVIPNARCNIIPRKGAHKKRKDSLGTYRSNYSDIKRAQYEAWAKSVRPQCKEGDFPADKVDIIPEYYENFHF